MNLLNYPSIFLATISSSSFGVTLDTALVALISLTTLGGV